MLEKSMYLRPAQFQVIFTFQCYCQFLISEACIKGQVTFPWRVHGLHTIISGVVIQYTRLSSVFAGLHISPVLTPG